MASNDPLVNGLQTFQDLVRVENHENAIAAEQSKRRQTDVTARWLGFDSNGLGLAEYEGSVYSCEVMSSVCKQKYAKINLRRTKNGNYCDWM